VDLNGDVDNEPPVMGERGTSIALQERGSTVSIAGLAAKEGSLAKMESGEVGVEMDVDPHRHKLQRMGLMTALGSCLLRMDSFTLPVFVLLSALTPVCPFLPSSHRDPQFPGGTRNIFGNARRSERRRGSGSCDWDTQHSGRAVCRHSDFLLYGKPPQGFAPMPTLAGPYSSS
jgi:hypothetical protein